jgi:TolB-like protein/Flp pilus assembly protein TadD
MKSLFAELKRRNVYKVAVAYAIVAWLLIQAASILFPTFEAPPWVMKVFIAAIVAGFPVALIFAWAFELTPEGIKRTDEVPANQSIANKTGRKLLAVVVALAVIAAALLVFQVTRRSTSSDLRKTAAPVTAPTVAMAPAIPLKSIAVLPFASLSEDKANAYFADGIQDEILTRLSKIAELKVISRTSTQQYQSKPGNLPEIAKQLGVAHILEGSVQKSGESVRVNVQLIKAEGDSHLWAETYDRKLTDIFAVETEVAQRIASSLEAHLSGREQEQVANIPTQNPQAYDAYLRGLALLNKQGFDQVEKAIEYLRKAVELDPQYAQAWAQLAVAESERYIYEHTAAQLERARRAGETAVRLQPELAEVHAGLSAFYYYGLGDFDRALGELEEARKRSPNDANAIFYSGLVKRRQGKLDEAIELQKKATVFDPRNSDMWVNLGRSYRGKRDFKSAREMFDRAIAIAPDEIDIVGMKAETYLAEGNLEAADELLRGRKIEELGDAFGQQITLLVRRRQFDEAVRRLSDLSKTAPGNGSPLVAALLKGFLGRLQIAAGHAAEGRSLLEESRRELLAQRAQGNTTLDIADALIADNAFLGDRQQLDREAEALLNATKSDLWRSPLSEEIVAGGYAIAGVADRAVPLIAHVLSLDYEFALTRAALRQDPIWDRIRSDPRFQKLANGSP